MPALKNHRHEAFAQALISGTAADAYAKSGMLRRPCGELDQFYVYGLIDPRDDTFFYIGKGAKQRYAAHVKEWYAGQVRNADKFSRIGAIIGSGHQVEIVCIEDGLDEDCAYEFEARIIEVAGFDRLTNTQPGTATMRQRSKVEAAHYLRRIKPFCEWQAGKSTQHIAWYWEVVGHLKQMADHGWVNEVKVSG